uniref:AIG1-type G domain-containing protein n=1 Tax=Sinocyclocheilus rhinocerous TaxID=307959 RepID=A0A673G049_9TELE
MCCSVIKHFHCSRNNRTQRLKGTVFFIEKGMNNVFTLNTLFSSRLHINFDMQIYLFCFFVNERLGMEELTIILLGKQGAGKSASGNTLLGCHAFHTAPSSERVTQACSMSMSTVDEQTITVIDTPGWCDSSQFETEMKITNEEITTFMNILKEFGDEAIKYMIVLFTKGDELEEKPIEDYLKDSHSDLQKIIRTCGGRFHVFNNRNKRDCQQTSSLLKKMNDMVKEKEKKCYTESMYNKNKKQLSSCDADEKEKEKGETMNDRKELEKLKQKMNELAKTTQENEMNRLKDMDQLMKDIQKLRIELNLMHFLLNIYALRHTILSNHLSII